MDKIFKFNTLNQPTRYPVDLDRLGINVYDVAPKWVYQDGRRTDVQITYYSEERPEVMGAATFASLDVSVWHMPERDMAGIALRGSGLRSLGSSPAVADEGEVEL